jgi:hypothetical protein
MEQNSADQQFEIQTNSKQYWACPLPPTVLYIKKTWLVYKTVWTTLIKNKNVRGKWTCAY